MSQDTPIHKVPSEKEWLRLSEWLTAPDLLSEGVQPERHAQPPQESRP